jgi:diaminobutyrate-2-oxoglutarate transaminase
MKNESNVNSYARVFPAVFDTAKGDVVFDNKGKKYIDFFSGAGALNYGHNHPKIKQAIFNFIEKDSIIHCLDMDSKIKEIFLEKFNTVILKPRNLDYKVQFPGPTGTNAVEAAIRLARKLTKRRKVVSFTNSFHGMTATSLALSGNLEERQILNPPQDVIFFPYDGYFGENIDTMAFLEKMVEEEGSGLEIPAAIILETIQAEGGVNIASDRWLQDLRKFTKKNNIVLIVDDIQVGCGRSGNFFSFERAAIIPDIVLLSKSISGFGLPLSLVLIKPEFDVWESGEYNGTFRSNNLSLCTANEALDFWVDKTLEKNIALKAEKINVVLQRILSKSNHVIAIRGIGMIWGVEFTRGEVVKKIAEDMFKQGILIETCGNKGQVLKLLAPLTISDDNLKIGLEKLEEIVMSLPAESVEKKKSIIEKSLNS